MGPLAEGRAGYHGLLARQPGNTSGGGGGGHWIARWRVGGGRQRCRLQRGGHAGRISSQLLSFLVSGSPTSRPLLVSKTTMAWLAMKKRGVTGMMGALFRVARRRGINMRSRATSVWWWMRKEGMIPVVLGLRVLVGCSRVARRKGTCGRVTREASERTAESHVSMATGTQVWKSASTSALLGEIRAHISTISSYFRVLA